MVSLLKKVILPNETFLPGVRYVWLLVWVGRLSVRIGRLIPLDFDV